MADVQGSAQQVHGTRAHDAPASDNPIVVAGRASANEPTAVSDGNVCDLWTDRFGRLVILHDHPSPEAPARAALTATSEVTLIAAPGAGVSIHVTAMAGSNDGAFRTKVDLKEGAGGTIRYTFVLAPRGGGFSHKATWKLPSNTALVLQQSIAVDSFVTIEYYLAP